MSSLGQISVDEKVNNIMSNLSQVDSNEIEEEEILDV